MPIELRPTKSISEIYFLANTPSFLYNMLRQDSYVQFLSNHDSKELISEFEKKSSQPIYTIEDMSLMYAILVALTIKPLNETKEFLQKVEERIKFEWFADIIKLFFNNHINDPIIKSETIIGTANSGSSYQIYSL